MAILKANGINIAYVENGDKTAPAILLIMGLGMQLTAWPDAFCEGLADRGFRVVRFDNRDVGLSTKFKGSGQLALAAGVVQAMLRLPVVAPYVLTDMADDAIGLLNALGIESAHIVGASMGGMIAQIIAADHPERVRSLTSIMSSSGNPRIRQGDPRLLRVVAWPHLVFRRERAIRQAMEFYRFISSPGFPTSEEELRTKVERSIDRCHYPAGMARHLLAIVASGSRVEMLERIGAPTLVLHGANDPLVPVEAGKDTAAHIPGATLRVIPGMAHDLPRGLQPILIDAIAEHCEKAERRAAGRVEGPRSIGRAQ